MTYEYFTPGDAEQYAYYRIPKMLITDSQFRGISMEAKLLYGVLLDRVSLSLKNGWVDEDNHVYIIFTIEQIMAEMNCGNKKAVSLLSELEKKIHLVEKKRQGLGKPNLLYVKNFFLSYDDGSDCGQPVDNSDDQGAATPEMSKGNSQKCQNDTSGSVERTSADMSKAHGTNTNNNKTDISKPDTILSNLSGDEKLANAAHDRMDGEDRKESRENTDCNSDDSSWSFPKPSPTEEYEIYRDYFTRHLSLDILLEDSPWEREELMGILDILVETCCSKRQVIRVGGEDKPAAIVRSKLMKLNSEHIRYVMHCLSENSSYIRNVRQYLLTTLYNAPSTITPFYRAWVNSNKTNEYS